MGTLRLRVAMKLNISYPETGAQKSIEIDDDKKLLPFFDKRISAEVAGDSLGDEFKGYRFRISGGNDKQGFPMMQGVLAAERVRLLLKKGSKCYRQRHWRDEAQVCSWLHRPPPFCAQPRCCQEWRQS